MGTAEVILCEEVHARKQWTILRQQLHERFDRWLNALKARLSETQPHLPEVTQVVRETVGRLPGQTTAALTAVAAVYCWLAFVFLPTGAYWNPDNGYRRLMVDSARFDPLPDFRVDYSGRWLDPQLQFLPLLRNLFFTRGDHLYITQPASIVLLSTPFIALFGDRGGLVMPIVFGMLSAYLVGRLTRKLDFAPEWVGVLITGLATPILIYSLVLWEHTLSVALSVGAVLLVMGEEESPKRWDAGLSGVLAALAASVRKELLLLAAMIGLVLVIRVLERGQWRRPWAWKAVFQWGAAFALVFGVYVLLNYLQTGLLVPSEIGINTPPQYSSNAYLLNHGLNSIVAFVFDARYGSLGSWLIIALLVYVFAGKATQTPVRRALQLVVLVVLAIGVWTFKPTGRLYGVLSVSPFLVLGLTPGYESDRAARDLWLIVLGFFTLAMIGLGLFTSRGPSRGPEWGARYFLPIFPLGVPLALAALKGLIRSSQQSWLARAQLGVGLFLIGLSAYLLILGVARMHTALTRMSLRGGAMLALPEKHIVSDLWWLPAETPAVYRAKDMFFVRSTEQFTAWVAAAHANGVEQFVYVSYRPMRRALLKALLPAQTHGTVFEDRVLGEGLHLIRIKIEPLP
jgi:hypothetical protein